MVLWSEKQSCGGIPEATYGAMPAPFCCPPRVALVHSQEGPDHVRELVVTQESGCT